MTITKNRPPTRNFLGQGNFHQIFHFLNKKIQKYVNIVLSTEWITLKSFIRKNRLINIVPEHCFDTTLADFEQIINNNFIQFEAEQLNDSNYSSRESNKFGIILHNFFKDLNSKNKKLKVLQQNHFFQLSFFF